MKVLVLLNRGGGAVAADGQIADKVEARFEHGVLQVRLPKHESAKPRKIPVKSE